MAVEPVSVRNGTMVSAATSLCRLAWHPNGAGAAQMVMPGWHRKGCLPRHLDTERQGFTHNIAQEVLPTGEAVHDIMMKAVGDGGLEDG